MPKSYAFFHRSLLAAALLLGTQSYADSLGTLTIDSTTIDDRFNSKQSEVSNTASINGERVDASHAENIQQILQSIPGVTTELQGGDSLKIHLRGVENQRYMGEKPGVAVVIDGVPVFERTGRVNIDLDNIASIKVIKGGASYLFGDDALSGAVIITTKRGASEAYNMVGVETGSFNYRKLLARTGISGDDYSAHLQVSQRSTDGYWDKSDSLSRYINGKLQYALDDTSDITFGLERSDREKDSHGTVGGVTEAGTNPQSVFDGDPASRDYARMYDVALEKFFLTYAKAFENGGNLLLNGYVYNDHTTFVTSPQKYDENGSRLSTYEDDAYVYDNDYRQSQRGVKSEYRQTFERSAMMLGLDLRRNSYDNTSTYRIGQRAGYRPPYTYYLPGDFKSSDETDEQVYAAYGEYKFAFSDDFSMTANMRRDTILLDYEDYTGQSLTKGFHVSSYRLGANYRLNDAISLYTNVSTGFRAPTITQLFAGDTSAWGYTQNNPDLKPEQAVNYEIGLRGGSGTLTYDMALFQIDRKDYIMKTSGHYGDADRDATDMYDNIGGMRNRGFEASAQSMLFDEQLYLNGAYTYIDAEYTDYKNFVMDLGADGTLEHYDVTGNTVPRVPAHHLNLNANYFMTEAADINLEADYTSEYYADDLNRLKMDAKTVVNLLANYRMSPGGFESEFFVRIDNLFDEGYYNTARSSSDRDENGVFDKEDLSITVNPGRVYTAGVRVTF